MALHIEKFCSFGIKETRQQVEGGEIVVLKNMFAEPEIDTARESLLRWRDATAPENLDRLSANRPFWRRDDNPPHSKTKHVFDTLHPGWDAPISFVFAKMEKLWSALTEQPAPPGMALRPQVLYYPSGGGHFDWHSHNLHPQKIGLIVGLSKSGRDFRSGSTLFETGGRTVSSGSDHDIGDVCLFRYDIPHAVSSIDPGSPKTWDGHGRWTAVLPLM